MNLLDALISIFLFKPEVMFAVILLPFFIMFLGLFIKSEKINGLVVKAFVGGFGLMFFLIFFMSMINTDLLGAGYIKKFDELAIREHALIAIDHLNSGDGEGNSWEHYRLHGVELPSGKKLFRTLLGVNYIGIAGYSQNTVWIEVNGEAFEGYDLTTGKKTAKVTKEILATKIPELSVGVESYSFLKNKNTLDVRAKNGLTYEVDALKLTVITQKNEAAMQSEIQPPFKLSSSVRKKIIGKNDRVLNPNLELIEGEILANYPDLKIVTAIGFESTDKKIFTLYGLSFEGKVLWQISQSELKLEDFYSTQNYYNGSIKFDQNLVVGVSGFLVSIDIKNGQVEWKERL